MTTADYHAAIFAAHKSGDMDSLCLLALELAGKLGPFEARAAKSAERQRRKRALQTVTSRDVTPCHADRVTPSSPLPSLSFPTPLLNPSFPPPSPTPQTPDALDLDLRLSALAGQRVRDLRRFLGSKPAHAQEAWRREFLKLAGPGSQFTPDDVANACDDALALDVPLTSPRGFRAFVAQSRLERLKTSRRGDLTVIDGEMSPALERATRPRLA